MTLRGSLASQRLSLKHRNAKLAAAFPKGFQCQKCLEYGHWSYECKAKRKFVHRISRTKHLKEHLAEKMNVKEETIVEPKIKRQKITDHKSPSPSSSDSDSPDSNSSSSDDSSSGSSDSESDSSSSASSADSESDSDTE